MDGLAATGLRSIRYLKEVPGISTITINDLCKNATDAARDNFISNKVYDENKVSIENKDATMLMYENREPLKNFDVIDIDPYGTAVPFLDAAVQVCINFHTCYLKQDILPPTNYLGGIRWWAIVRYLHGYDGPFRKFP